ncbi:MAG: acetyl-CoA carboxylase [Armatimonadota bacterium]
MHFDDDDVRWLLNILEEKGLAEIEVARGDLRIRVCAREVAPSASSLPAHAPGAAAAQAAVTPAPAGLPVPAPMAGIFYRQPAPGADPFVEEGDRVEAGQVVGLIEVMKLFNEIIAPVAGVVTRIVVANEERVEADQPLMYIQPALKGGG